MENLLRKMPTIETFNALNVWTPYANLMRKWHQAMNGEWAPFDHVNMWTMENGQATSHSNDAIIQSMSKRDDLDFFIQTGIGLRLRGVVAMAIPFPEVETAWILGLEGTLGRYTHEKSTAAERVTVPIMLPCYYETEYGRGFCLLPKLATEQIWC